MLQKFHRLWHIQLKHYIHSIVACNGLTNSVLENNRRLNSLLKSGQINEARKIFDKMSEKDAFSWNTMITGYAHLGKFVEAKELLNKIPTKSTITWNTLISGYCHHGCVDEAFETFGFMLFLGFKPSQFTVGSILRVCSKSGLLQNGRELHSFVVKTQLDSSVVVVTSLLDMYAKCNCVDEAEILFDVASNTDNHVLWTAMITGYSYNGYACKAILCFKEMHKEGIAINEFTFPSVLNACAEVLDLDFGKELHSCVVKCGSAQSVFVKSALIDMYSKCGDLGSARVVLDATESDNTTVWNSMISGFARTGLEEEALSFFKTMHARNIKIDEFTYPTILKCFSSDEDSSRKAIHSLIIKSGFDDHNLISNALIDTYMKAGDIDDALRVFSSTPRNDVIAWTSLITGYMQNSLHEEALRTFYDMRTIGIFPDEFVMSSILGACAELAVLTIGQQVHAIVVKLAYGSSVSINNPLIAMYAKCGCIEESRRVFDSMRVRDLISWTLLLMGCAQNSLSNESIRLYEQMVTSGMKPDYVSFIGLLFACSHAGRVEKGQNYFDTMDKVYGIKPGPEHYACMIDLLGRCGKTEEAKKLLNRMTVKPDVTLWKSLLSSCRTHRDVELAERAANQLFELEPRNAVPYVMLANISSTMGRWKDSARIRRMMKSRGIGKEPGCSWIEIEGKVHTFMAEDRTHPRTNDICSKVNEIIHRIMKFGYKPDTRFALHDMNEEAKRLNLAHHSEKLAVAFGILSLPPRLPIRIFKNLRVCGDCHTAMKFISEVYDRYIVLRDSNRFHHFKNGMCSCQDYW